MCVDIYWNDVGAAGCNLARRAKDVEYVVEDLQTFFLISPFIVPPVLLQTISTLMSLLMACRKCIQ